MVSREEVIQALGEAVQTCLNCAERSGEQHIDCEKCCRGCAILFDAAQKFLMIGDQPETSQLLSLCKKLAKRCNKMCSHHHEGHCQECANNTENLLSTLRKFYPMESAKPKLFSFLGLGLATAAIIPAVLALVYGLKTGRSRKAWNKVKRGISEGMGGFTGGGVLGKEIKGKIESQKVGEKVGQVVNQAKEKLSGITSEGKRHYEIGKHEHIPEEKKV